MLHLNPAAQNGQRNAYTKTVDTSVVVPAMAYINQLDSAGSWARLGPGKHFSEIPHFVLCANNLGPTFPVPSVVPCLHWMWCCRIHVWNWKKDSMECIACIPIPHKQFNCQAIWTYGHMFSISKYICASKRHLTGWSMGRVMPWHQTDWLLTRHVGNLCK